MLLILVVDFESIITTEELVPEKWLRGWLYLASSTTIAVKVEILEPTFPGCVRTFSINLRDKSV